LPGLAELRAALELKSQEFRHIVKKGRTHTQDATPLTLGQEFSGYLAKVVHGERWVSQSLEDVMYLAQGTAVGTGLNTYVGFDYKVAAQVLDSLSRLLRISSRP
jgi:fumarate hydratase class II